MPYFHFDTTQLRQNNLGRKLIFLIAANACLSLLPKFVLDKRGKLLQTFSVNKHHRFQLTPKFNFFSSRQSPKYAILICTIWFSPKYNHCSFLLNLKYTISYHPQYKLIFCHSIKLNPILLGVFWHFFFQIHVAP